ncbi:Zinc finger, CCHC-type [Sesbania bispinosa]|nr:Zinc finger, CCHC-type [Sesbania bispinosa]
MAIGFQFKIVLFSLFYVLCFTFSFAHIIPRFPSSAIHPEQQLRSASAQNGLYQTKFFTQILDHFNYNPKSYHKFQQRYLINDTYWGGAKKKAPIFVYTGNEGNIEWFTQNTGFMFEKAPYFKALLVFIEHRFYGKSIPFGGNKTVAYANSSTLGYLSSTQALADYATLIIDLKKNLSAIDSPVVVFGGSYGGMLAAWFRMKYPHITIGALASSAPILHFMDLVSPCLQQHRHTRLQDGVGVYGNDRLSDAIQFPVSVASISSEKGNNTLAKLYAAANIFYNYTGTATCFDLNDTSDPHDLGGWQWQACTEMIMPTGGNNKESIFPKSDWSYRISAAFCDWANHVKPRPHWITTEFGGHDIDRVLKRSASNIIFFNGLRDPWSGGGVLKNISKSLVAIVAKEGAHHVDLRYSTKEDPKWLTDGFSKPLWGCWKSVISEKREDGELFEFESAEQGAVSESKETEGTNDFLGDPLCPVVKLTALEREAIRIPWKRSLLVKLLGKRIGLRFFHARLLKMWRSKGTMEMIDIDNRWQPSFCPMADDLRRVGVWVRIPGLPIEFYDKRVLWRIGNVLGKIVKIDYNTLREKPGSQEGKTYNVEYEGLHLVCFQCGRYGHRKEGCPLLLAPNAANDDNTVLPTPPQGPPEHQEEVQTFGPWMIAQKSQRRNQRVTSGNQGSKSVDTSRILGDKNISGKKSEALGSRFNILQVEDSDEMPPQVDNVPHGQEQGAKSAGILKRKNKGGIWVLWKEDICQIQIMEDSAQFIHIKVSPHDGSHAWLLTCVYASPQPANREALWCQLESLVASIQEGWVLVGDFNSYVSSEEKFGGAAANFPLMHRFRDMIDNCSLPDLGFTAPPSLGSGMELKRDWTGVYVIATGASYSLKP